jgi:hypothetical protein
MTPRTFKDAQNRVWLVAVVYNTIVNVLAKTGIDLRHLAEDYEATAAELDNPATVKQIVGILLEDQLEKANCSVDDLFQQITTNEMSDAVVLSIYQATFDFFQGQGGVLNDALGRVQRAMETAQAHRTQRMKQEVDSGNMDKFLAIVFDPDQMAEWGAAAIGPQAIPAIAAVWKEILDADLPAAKLFPTLVKTCLAKGLTPLPSAAVSVESSASTPAPTVGET